MWAPTLTASQTVGPLFHDCLMREDARCDVLGSPSTEGTRIRVEGRVIDGDGEPVPEAVLERWQANAHGRYAHPADRRDLPLEVSRSSLLRPALPLPNYVAAAA